MRKYYQHHLRRVDILINNVFRHAPKSNPTNDEYLADLAGMVCVSCVAAYENSIKEILTQHARLQHSEFGNFVERHFERLNSRIYRSDLEKYARLFDPNLVVLFKERLDESEYIFARRTQGSIKSSYANMLQWRHAFAHSGQRSATLEEVRISHLYCKRLLHCFAYALDLENKIKTKGRTKM